MPINSYRQQMVLYARLKKSVWLMRAGSSVCVDFISVISDVENLVMVFSDGGTFEPSTKTLGWSEVMLQNTCIFHHLAFS